MTELFGKPGRAVFVSPHLDDVVFSCGGIARMLADAGWTTQLCTVFTRSVLAPTGFALACQLDKGLAPDVDYMALRRGEDALAARTLHFAGVVWLDLPEAPHRGYASAPALFGPYVVADTIGSAVETALEPHLREADLVFAPQGLGDHVDHRRVRESLAGRSNPVVWYRDTPYALREPAAVPRFGVPIVGRDRALVLTPAALAAKLDACAAYRTQIGFQFGGESSLRTSLRDFAFDEGARFGASGPAESVRFGSPAEPLAARNDGACRRR